MGVHLLERTVGELEEVTDGRTGPEDAFHEFAGEVLREVGDGGGGDEVEALGEGAGEPDHGGAEIVGRARVEEREDGGGFGGGEAAAGETRGKLQAGEVAGQRTDKTDERGVFLGEREFDEFAALVENALQEFGAIGFSGGASGGGSRSGKKDTVGEVGATVERDTGVGRDALGEDDEGFVGERFGVRDGEAGER